MASVTRTELNTEAWQRLGVDYAKASARPDSLDTLVEWPAERHMIGDVRGLSILDLGCADGSKVAQLVNEGAALGVGTDVSGTFIEHDLPGLELVRGDLSDPTALPATQNRLFDRILFLQSFGYAQDPVKALIAAKSLLTPDGFILLTRTQPIRYARERAEANGTSLGEEYFTQGEYTYNPGWNPDITLTKRTYTMSDLLNTISAAGLWIEETMEPHLSAEQAEAFPHKQEWMGKYLGILIFKLRPLPAR